MENLDKGYVMIFRSVSPISDLRKDVEQRRKFEFIRRNLTRNKEDCLRLTRNFLRCLVRHPFL